jgi:hypothetical protein
VGRNIRMLKVIGILLLALFNGSYHKKSVTDLVHFCFPTILYLIPS